MKRIMIGFLVLMNLSFPVKGKDSLSREERTIEGYIQDKSNGEALIGATISVKETSHGTTTNIYGFYSISLIPGKYTLIFSYIGFSSKKINIELTKDQIFSIELEPNTEKIDEVTIRSEQRNINITRPEMSMQKLGMKTIRQIPALMGEVDIIKAIQLLPGIQSTSEGGSGFSVRGGCIDQNLIILDEAPIYNASHLMGFFSVFNNDAIRDVKLYKGGIPASYGGRLSSLLDIRMKEGNNKKLSTTGGIGTLSSRLTIEAPIIKNKTSFIVSGRRTYIDLFLPFSKDPLVKNTSIYFYDLNIKMNHKINHKNKIYLSGYFGRDIFKNSFAKMGFGNGTFTSRWNHLFSKKLFMNMTLIKSKYDYRLGSESSGEDGFVWDSYLKDWGGKVDFTYFFSSKSTLEFGSQTTYHSLSPGIAKGSGEKALLNEFIIPKNHALEHGIYGMNKQKITKNLIIKYGVRLSVFQNIGEGVVYKYDQYHKAIDSTKYKSWNIINSFWGIEPRLGVNFIINPLLSIKGSYSRTRQYVQLASNSLAGTPLDIWFPASRNIKPQIADQYALGVFKNLFSNEIEVSIEVYYKKMQNTIDFKDHAKLLLNRKLEGETRAGSAKSYGLEVLIRKNKGRINGWISYTLSKTERSIPEINQGKTYLAPYDKTHDISIVGSYKLNKRITLSANWLFTTGAAATFPTGRMKVMGKIAPIYTERNASRYPNYHRLDFSLTIKGKRRPKKKWQEEWVLSIYNFYNQHNPWTINFVQDKENPDIVHTQKTYLFPILPSVTYNFNF